MDSARDRRARCAISASMTWSTSASSTPRRANAALTASGASRRRRISIMPAQSSLRRPTPRYTAPTSPILKRRATITRCRSGRRATLLGFGEQTTQLQPVGDGSTPLLLHTGIREQNRSRLLGPDSANAVPGAAGLGGTTSFARITGEFLTKLRPYVIEAPQVLAYRLALQCPRRHLVQSPSSAERHTNGEPDSSPNLFGDVWPRVTTPLNAATAECDDAGQPCAILGAGRFPAPPTSASGAALSADRARGHDELGRLFVLRPPVRHGDHKDRVALEG